MLRWFIALMLATPCVAAPTTLRADEETSPGRIVTFTYVHNGEEMEAVYEVTAEEGFSQDAAHLTLEAYFETMSLALSAKNKELRAVVFDTMAKEGLNVTVGAVASTIEHLSKRKGVPEEAKTFSSVPGTRLMRSHRLKGAKIDLTYRINSGEDFDKEVLAFMTELFKLTNTILSLEQKGARDVSLSVLSLTSIQMMRKVSEALTSE